MLEGLSCRGSSGRSPLRLGAAGTSVSPETNARLETAARFAVAEFVEATARLATRLGTHVVSEEISSTRKEQTTEMR